MLGKIKFLLQALGLMLVVMVLIGLTYFFSIVGAVVLGVFLLYALVREYNSGPPDSDHRQ